MTLEHRMLVGLADIKAVVLECGACQGRISHALEKIDFASLDNCPHCGERWMLSPPTGHVAARVPLARLLDALKVALVEQRATPAVRVFFEFEAPNAKS